MARKYFGDEDPVGKVLSVEEAMYRGEYTVIGVVEVPDESSIRFDFLVSTVTHEEPRGYLDNWHPTYNVRPVQNYVVLREGSDSNKLEEKLPDLMASYMGEEIRASNTYYLQPLKRIHLYSKLDYGFGWRGDIDQIYQLAAIASFILLIACINFTNLATARSSGRAREVGVRKAVGSDRSQLVQQFQAESLLTSLLTSLLAMLLALLLAKLALPEFNAFMSKELSLTAHPWTLAWGLIGLVVVVGLLAGAYPAFVLAAFHPVQVLKGSATAGPRGVWLRRTLVVSQFAISILLMIATAVVYDQLTYMSNKELGFDKEHLIRIPVFTHSRAMATTRDDRLSRRYDAVKSAFSKHPNVEKVAAYRFSLGWGGIIRTVRPQGVRGVEWQIRIMEIDEDFLDTFGIDIVVGRNFTPQDTYFTEIDRPEPAIILNQTAVEQLGWEADPIGKQMEWIVNGQVGAVIGVVRDFNSRSLREAIAPVAFVARSSNFHFLGIRIRNQDLSETLAFLETQWKVFVSDRPFEFAFVDDRLDMLYRDEMRFGQVSGLFALMAIFVACLGLSGLASFSAAQRRREVGIRKVLGASLPSVTVLLSTEFLKLVGVATLIAWPVGYFVMTDWLQAYAYRVDLSPVTFALAGLLALGIALATVSSQAIRAASANPVKSLRYE